MPTAHDYFPMTKLLSHARKKMQFHRILYFNFNELWQGNM